MFIFFISLKAYYSIDDDLILIQKTLHRSNSANDDEEKKIVTGNCWTLRSHENERRCIINANKCWRFQDGPKKKTSFEVVVGRLNISFSLIDFTFYSRPCLIEFESLNFSLVDAVWQPKVLQKSQQLFCTNCICLSRSTVQTQTQKTLIQ